MREILFRAKRLDGIWVQGDLRQVDGKAYILDYDTGDNGVSEQQRIFDIAYEVDPATVGQYTGLTDKGGKRIFEGDILERRILPTKRIAIRFRIAWVPVKACLSAIDIDGSSVTFISDYIHSGYETEIIGNIYDNPELLEVHHD